MQKTFVGPEPPDLEKLTREARVLRLRGKLQSTAAWVGACMAILTAIWVGWRTGLTLLVLVLMFGWIRKAGKLGNELKAMMEKGGRDAN